MQALVAYIHLARAPCGCGASHFCPSLHEAVLVERAFEAALTQKTLDDGGDVLAFTTFHKKEVCKLEKGQMNVGALTHKGVECDEKVGSDKGHHEQAQTGDAITARGVRHTVQHAVGTHGTYVGIAPPQSIDAPTHQQAA